MICSICSKNIDRWLRREYNVYCMSCYKEALGNLKGLSTHANEEANNRRRLTELEGQ